VSRTRTAVKVRMVGEWASNVIPPRWKRVVNGGDDHKQFEEIMSRCAEGTNASPPTRT